jgi:hypothetical protein
MLKNLKLRLLIILVLLGVTFRLDLAFSESTSMMNSSSASNENNRETGIKKERRTELNFEDELVEGSTQKPELFYLFQKKNFNYKRLIKLRENFLPEMRKSTEDVQRVRGGH